MIILHMWQFFLVVHQNIGDDLKVILPPKGIDLQYKLHEFHSFFYNSTFSRQKKVSNTYLTIRAKRACIALSWSSSITSFYFKEIQRRSKGQNTPILWWVPQISHNVVMNQTSKFDINTTQNFPLIRLL